MMKIMPKKNVYFYTKSNRIIFNINNTAVDQN
jgi:hypothetical protein